MATMLQYNTTQIKTSSFCLGSNFGSNVGYYKLTVTG